MNLKTPSELKTPSFLLNFPFTVDNHTLNNPLMHKDQGKYDYPRAFRQFMGLYSELVREGALVYLLPSEKDLQDLPYTANLGCYLPHLDTPTILVSNFKSEPRRGEEEVGIKFFLSMRYRAHLSPYFWEGEADLKYIRDNLYVGGHGIRSDIRSYHWFEERFKMKILFVKMTNEKLYHLDCMFFPISNDKALAATSIIDTEDIKQLEKHMDLIEVPKEFIYDGWTNLIRIKDKIFYTVPETAQSRRALDNLINQLGYDTVPLNLGEFDKSGADLSCLVMHLNFVGRT